MKLPWPFSLAKWKVQISFTCSLGQRQVLDQAMARTTKRHQAFQRSLKFTTASPRTVDVPKRLLKNALLLVARMLLIVMHLLLVPMPLLLIINSFLFLVVRPGATSSVLAPSTNLELHTYIQLRTWPILNGNDKILRNIRHESQELLQLTKNNGNPV